jgi:hypothetical protein
MGLFEDAWRNLADLSATLGKDCYIYVGNVNRNGYDQITDEFIKKKTKSAYLFLATYGGDPSAGYRIARGFRHHYEHLIIVIPTYCKSAGTLMAIGADELVIADKGELGPLDMQLKKPDELFDMSSGLDITQAMAFLRSQSTDILKSALVDLNVQLSVTTKTAAEIATKLTTGLIAPIYAQIDPYKIGESQRAVSIAFSYGKRLNDKVKNLKTDDSLRSLMLDYPSHGFVIDRKEASTLFNKVRAPSDVELKAVESLYGLCHDPDVNNPFVAFIPPSAEGTSNDTVQSSPGTGVKQAVDASEGVAGPADEQSDSGDEGNIAGTGEGRP